MKKYQKLSHLSEKYKGEATSQDYFKHLLKIYESIIRNLRENIHPFAEEYKAEGMSDYITGLMQEHEKTAWMIRAHLK